MITTKGTIIVNTLLPDTLGRTLDVSHNGVLQLANGIFNEGLVMDDIGHNLYNCYRQACEERSCTVDAWEDLDDNQREEWRRTAAHYHEFLTSQGRVYIQPESLNHEIR